MSSKYNRAGFLAAVAGELHELPRAYCNLVVVELAIKDKLSVAGLSHDLPRMLQKIGLANKPYKAALNQHICELTNRITAIKVTAIDGTSSNARAASYPDIRYIRHSSDWTEDFSTDKEVEDLRICIAKIRAFLQKNLAIY